MAPEWPLKFSLERKYMRFGALLSPLKPEENRSVKSLLEHFVLPIRKKRLLLQANTIRAGLKN
jgi:hypothetical protein